MEMQAFQYINKQGWTVDSFPDLDSENTLVLIFAAPLFFSDKEPIDQLTSFYPLAKILGCSTAGEIFGGHIVDESMSVVVTKFAHTSLKVTKVSVDNSQSSFDVGAAVVQALQGDQLCSIFILSDGLIVNGSELVKGLNTSAQKIIITGGLAANGSTFNKTWQILNGEILERHTVAVGFYGTRLQIGHASRGGWDIFGPVRRITRSYANRLYELDYKPALQLYKEYLGEQASDLPASGVLYPLEISDPASTNSTKLVRTILAIDEPNQALIFGGDMPSGFNAQLMRANFDRLIDSAYEAGKISSLHQNQPILTISISCVGRRLLLGERTEEEIDATLSALPAGSIQAGFYSYGELSPYASGACELHNQTMTITTFYET